jgi:nuclear transport factor 2 (NTF2) superfamily protein
MSNLQSTSSPPPSTESKQFAGGGEVSSNPLPPFDSVSAAVKVRNAENAWNSRDPDRVSLGYTPDSVWRNRSTFLTGRPAIVAFLRQKWDAEIEYRLIKELWAFQGNRIAVRFAYESRDAQGHWNRSYGNENWEFDDRGLMRWRIASINDLSIGEHQRLFKWPLGLRPLDHKGLSELGL